MPCPPFSLPKTLQCWRYCVPTFLLGELSEQFGISVPPQILARIVSPRISRGEQHSARAAPIGYYAVRSTRIRRADA
jgi:hypothetical protein